MSQQDLNAFADWLVANQSKRGTPEFETVANAFRELDAQLGQRDGAFAPSVDRLHARGKGIEAVGELVGSERARQVRTLSSSRTKISQPAATSRNMPAVSQAISARRTSSRH